MSSLKLYNDETPVEIKILFKDFERSRIAMNKVGFDKGTPLNRLTDEQYVFNTSTHTLNMPYIEYKHWPEWDMDDPTDAFMSSAEILASKGKTIDFFWSGGIDSTAALIALNEICPKQLHVIIGHSTEYPEYYDKVVRHLDHTIDTSNNVFSIANPDKNILCPCGQGDEVFGAPGMGKARLKYECTPELLYNGWELKREYKWTSGSLRFVQEFGGDKMDMNNHLPFYVQEPLEKWSINQHRKGLNGSELFTYNPKSLPMNYLKDEYYVKFKIPMRNFIYKFTKDKKYAYEKGKLLSLVRAQPLPLHHPECPEPKVWGIIDDGTILTRDNIDQYDWRGFLHHYKKEFS